MDNKKPDPMAEDNKLREWLADFATGMQGDSYYTIYPDDIANSDIKELKDLTNAYTTNKIIEAREGGLDKPSDTASVDGSQVVDPILVSELFRMVYQWGRVGVVVDSSAPAFQAQLTEVIRSLK